MTSDDYLAQMEKFLVRVVWITSGVVALTGIVYQTVLSSNERYNVRETNIKEGYISPKRVEITYQDVDRDGNLETILEVDNKPYLLMNKNDKPALFEYKLVSRNGSIIIEK